jgi:HSP20 family protein
MARDTIRRTSVFHAPTGDRGWVPALDVYQLRDGWLVKADLAGVRPQEVAVRVVGRTLTIAGARHDTCIGEGCALYLMEISYSRFERSIDLPCDPGPADVQTDYRDGMLLIHIRCGCPT